MAFAASAWIPPQFHDDLSLTRAHDEAKIIINRYLNNEVNKENFEQGCVLLKSLQEPESELVLGYLSMAIYIPFYSDDKVGLCHDTHHLRANPELVIRVLIRKFETNRTSPSSFLHVSDLTESIQNAGRATTLEAASTNGKAPAGKILNAKSKRFIRNRRQVRAANAVFSDDPDLCNVDFNGYQFKSKKEHVRILIQSDWAEFYREMRLSVEFSVLMDKYNARRVMLDLEEMNASFAIEFDKMMKASFNRISVLHSLSYLKEKCNKMNVNMLNVFKRNVKSLLHSAMIYTPLRNARVSAEDLLKIFDQHEGRFAIEVALKMHMKEFHDVVIERNSIAISHY